MGDRFGGVDWIILDTNFPSYARVLQTKHAPASRNCPRMEHLPMYVYVMANVEFEFAHSRNGWDSF